MRRRSTVVWFLAALAVLLVADGAGAQSAGPPMVQWASLIQSGQNLAWLVQLSGPFSASGLARRHETLCLLIESVATGAVRQQVCLAPPRRRGASARLVYIPDGGGQHALPAIVTHPRPTVLRAMFVPTAAGLHYGTLRWQSETALAPTSCGTQPSCSALFPAMGRTLKLHVPKLVGCVASGPPYVTRGPSRGRLVALTFDDGPWYDTPQFLNVLESKHVVATFFEIGEQIATYGQGGAIERRMLRDGDMIGDHSWSHPNLAGDGSFAAGQIASTASAIQRATGGFRPCLFRAPGGGVSGALIAEARRMGFTTIEWTVDTRDWARPGTGSIYGTVVSNTRPGSIVLQHDGGGDRSETLAAVPREIDTLRREGYQFVTVTQLLGYRLIYK